MKDLIQANLKEAMGVLEEFSGQTDNIIAIESAATILIDTLKRGNKIISCGNGGSMTDAMHFAEELSGFYRDKRAPIPALCISDPSHISCVANDAGYEFVFSRYVEAIGRTGDVLLAISSSGNSMNIIKAIESAHEKGMKVIGLTGRTGGLMAGMVDQEIRVKGRKYADRIQEMHIKILHILALLIEDALVQK
jgi:D-sedoheptulose 7-phosphate isomerase